MQGRNGNDIMGLQCVETASSHGARTVVSFPVQSSPPPGSGHTYINCSNFEAREGRGRHIDVACRSVCDRDQNRIKRSSFFLGADQGIKVNSERIISTDQRTF